MLRAAVKLPVLSLWFFVLFVVLRRVRCTIVNDPFLRFLTRVRCEPWALTQRSPSIRARAHARGPQRLFSLDPDTCAAAPSLWRSRGATRTQSVRAARVRRRAGCRARRPSGSRPSGTTPGRRHSATARSAACARPRQSQSGARASRSQTAPDTTASARCAVATAPNSTPAAC